jgi:hypothetical protein
MVVKCGLKYHMAAQRQLPISSRRAFKRVLATIKTIALVHQRQRSRDEVGRVFADYADYALAYQLVGESFREALGDGRRYTDDRIRLIEQVVRSRQSVFLKNWRCLF